MDKVVVIIPADFVMAESVHQLMSELTALVYKYGAGCRCAALQNARSHRRCCAQDQTLPWWGTRAGGHWPSREILRCR